MRPGAFSSYGAMVPEGRGVGRSTGPCCCRRDRVGQTHFSALSFPRPCWWGYRESVATGRQYVRRSPHQEVAQRKRPDRAHRFRNRHDAAGQLHEKGWVELTQEYRCRQLGACICSLFDHPETVKGLRGGRLDAQRIADVLEVPLAALAKALRLTRAALARRPTGSGGPERVAAPRERLGGTPTRARRRQGHPRLAPHGPARTRGHAPINLLREGSVQALADYVDSALAGQPS